jgi:hypothetical protein
MERTSVSKPKCLLVDLDGTLAIVKVRNVYDASQCDIFDEPNLPVVETVRALVMNGYEVVFVSGREDKYREPTERFIKRCFPAYQWQLFMRKSGDTRPDTVVKEELYKNHIEMTYNVLLVLDDRASVCAKWREMGLTCFAVNAGDFDWKRFHDNRREAWQCDYVRNWAGSGIACCTKPMDHKGKHESVYLDKMEEGKAC